MTTPLNDFQSLFDKLLEGSLSSEETEKIVDLLESDALEPGIKELIMAHLEAPTDEDDIKKDIAHSLQERLPRILGTGTQKARVVVLKQNWLKYVAAIIIIIIGAMVYLLQPENKSPVAANEDNNGKPVIRPGKDRAVLTLADGKEIFLDSTQGDILQENDFSVVNKNGELDYEGNMNRVEQHLLSTPRGGQYQLKLPDGTKVWMNAESSITFPTAFTGNTRKVSIKGEVYFEVKANMNKPFIVEVNNTMAIQVLGTSFNINSYNDEEGIAATLLEGSIKVISDGENRIIIPGQQARIKSEKIAIANNVDVTQVVAWKNGLFNFNNADLSTVMRQVSRWYDVEIQYEGKIPEIKFMGKIQRALNLADVLEGFKTSGINFTIKNKTIIVKE